MTKFPSMVTAVSDAGVVTVACDQKRVHAVVEALTCVLAALGADFAVIEVESGATVAKNLRDAERVQRAAASN